MATVLIVDDEDVLLEMIVALVEELGHDALSATNGAEALAVLQQRAALPALILSDVMMPRMSGTDLVRIVKADARLQAVPVILMSAAVRLRENTLADAFVHKPFDLDMLTSLIEQYLAPPTA